MEKYFILDKDLKNQIKLMAEDGVHHAFIAKQLNIPISAVSQCMQIKEFPIEKERNLKQDRSSSVEKPSNSFDKHRSSSSKTGKMSNANTSRGRPPGTSVFKNTKGKRKLEDREDKIAKKNRRIDLLDTNLLKKFGIHKFVKVSLNRVSENGEPMEGRMMPNSNRKGGSLKNGESTNKDTESSFKKGSARPNKTVSDDDKSKLRDTKPSRGNLSNQFFKEDSLRNFKRESFTSSCLKNDKNKFDVTIKKEKNLEAEKSKDLIEPSAHSSTNNNEKRVGLIRVRDFALLSDVKHENNSSTSSVNLATISSKTLDNSSSTASLKALPNVSLRDFKINEKLVQAQSLNVNIKTSSSTESARNASNKKLPNSKDPPIRVLSLKDFKETPTIVLSPKDFCNKKNVNNRKKEPSLRDIKIHSSRSDDLLKKSLGKTQEFKKETISDKEIKLNSVQNLERKNSSGNSSQEKSENSQENFDSSRKKSDISREMSGTLKEKHIGIIVSNVENIKEVRSSCEQNKDLSGRENEPDHYSIIESVTEDRGSSSKSFISKEKDSDNINMNTETESSFILNIERDSENDVTVMGKEQGKPMTDKKKGKVTVDDEDEAIKKQKTEDVIKKKNKLNKADNNLVTGDTGNKADAHLSKVISNKTDIGITVIDSDCNNDVDIMTTKDIGNKSLTNDKSHEIDIVGGKTSYEAAVVTDKIKKTVFNKTKKGDIIQKESDSGTRKKDITRNNVIDSHAIFSDTDSDNDIDISTCIDTIETSEDEENSAINKSEAKSKVIELKSKNCEKANVMTEKFEKSKSLVENCEKTKALDENCKRTNIQNENCGKTATATESITCDKGDTFKTNLTSREDSNMVDIDENEPFSNNNDVINKGNSLITELDKAQTNKPSNKNNAKDEGLAKTKECDEPVDESYTQKTKEWDEPVDESYTQKHSEAVGSAMNDGEKRLNEVISVPSSAENKLHENTSASNVKKRPLDDISVTRDDEKLPDEHATVSNAKRFKKDNENKTTNSISYMSKVEDIELFRKAISNLKATQFKQSEKFEDQRNRKKFKFKDERIEDCMYECPKYSVLDTENLMHSYKNLVCGTCYKHVDVKFTSTMAVPDTEFQIKCGSCNHVRRFKRSRSCISEVDFKVIGYDSLYLRLIFSCLDFGGGLSQLQSTCMALNIPQLNVKSFKKYCSYIISQSEIKLDTILKSAGEVVLHAYENIGITTDERGIKEVKVLFDSSWIKSSKNNKFGLVVVIDVMTGLVLDYHLMIKYCSKCSFMKKKIPKSFELWRSRHKKRGVCQINCESAQEDMEMDGAIILCRRSILKHKLKYKSISVINFDIDKYTNEGPVMEEKTNSGAGGDNDKIQMDNVLEGEPPVNSRKRLSSSASASEMECENPSENLGQYVLNLDNQELGFNSRQDVDCLPENSNIIVESEKSLDVNGLNLPARELTLCDVNNFATLSACEKEVQELNEKVPNHALEEINISLALDLGNLCADEENVEDFGCYLDNSEILASPEDDPVWLVGQSLAPDVENEPLTETGTTLNDMDSLVCDGNIFCNYNESELKIQTINTAVEQESFIDDEAMQCLSEDPKKDMVTSAYDDNSAIASLLTSNVKDLDVTKEDETLKEDSLFENCMVKDIHKENGEQVQLNGFLSGEEHFDQKATNDKNTSHLANQRNEIHKAKDKINEDNIMEASLLNLSDQTIDSGESNPDSMQKNNLLNEGKESLSTLNWQITKQKENSLEPSLKNKVIKNDETNPCQSRINDQISEEDTFNQSQMNDLIFENGSDAPTPNQINNHAPEVESLKHDQTDINIQDMEINSPSVAFKDKKEDHLSDKDCLSTRQIEPFIQITKTHSLSSQVDKDHGINIKEKSAPSIDSIQPLDKNKGQTCSNEEFDANDLITKEKNNDQMDKNVREQATEITSQLNKEQTCEDKKEIRKINKEDSFLTNACDKGDKLQGAAENKKTLAKEHSCDTDVKSQDHTEDNYLRKIQACDKEYLSQKNTEEEKFFGKEDKSQDSIENKNSLGKEQTCIKDKSEQSTENKFSLAKDKSGHIEDKLQINTEFKNSLGEEHSCDIKDKPQKSTEDNNSLKKEHPCHKDNKPKDNTKDKNSLVEQQSCDNEDKSQNSTEDKNSLEKEHPCHKGDEPKDNTQDKNSLIEQQSCGKEDMLQNSTEDKNSLEKEHPCHKGDEPKDNTQDKNSLREQQSCDKEDKPQNSTEYKNSLEKEHPWDKDEKPLGEQQSCDKENKPQNSAENKNSLEKEHPCDKGDKSKDNSEDKISLGEEQSCDKEIKPQNRTEDKNSLEKEHPCDKSKENSEDKISLGEEQSCDKEVKPPNRTEDKNSLEKEHPCDKDDKSKDNSKDKNSLGEQQSCDKEDKPQNSTKDKNSLERELPWDKDDKPKDNSEDINSLGEQQSCDKEDKPQNSNEDKFLEKEYVCDKEVQPSLEKDQTFKDKSPDSSEDQDSLTNEKTCDKEDKTQNSAEDKKSLKGNILDKEDQSQDYSEEKNAVEKEQNCDPEHNLQDSTKDKISLENEQKCDKDKSQDSSEKKNSLEKEQVCNKDNVLKDIIEDNNSLKKIVCDTKDKSQDCAEDKNSIEKEQKCDKEDKLQDSTKDKVSLENQQKCDEEDKSQDSENSFNKEAHDKKDNSSNSNEYEDSLSNEKACDKPQDSAEDKNSLGKEQSSDKEDTLKTKTKDKSESTKGSSSSESKLEEEKTTSEQSSEHDGTNVFEALKNIKTETLRSNVLKNCNIATTPVTKEMVEFACNYAIIAHNINIENYMGKSNSLNIL